MVFLHIASIAERFKAAWTPALCGGMLAASLSAACDSGGCDDIGIPLLNVVARDPDNQLICSAEFETSPEASAGPCGGGACTFWGPVGKYRVIASAPGYENAEATVTVRGDDCGHPDTEDVTLVLEPVTDSSPPDRGCDDAGP